MKLTDRLQSTEGPVTGAGLRLLVHLHTSVCVTWSWLIILTFSRKCHWSVTHYWPRTWVKARVCAICQSFFCGSRRSGCAPRTGLGSRPVWLGPSSSLCSVPSGRPWRGGLLWQFYRQSSPAWHWTGCPNVLEGDYCWNVLCFPRYCRTLPRSRTEPSGPTSSCVRSWVSTSCDQPWHQQTGRTDQRKRTVTTVGDRKKGSIFYYGVWLHNRYWSAFTVCHSSANMFQISTIKVFGLNFHDEQD